MSPTRAGTVAADVLGLRPGERKGSWQVPPGRELVISSDFYIVNQVLGQADGVTHLWCWAHMRRYFIRAGDAHPQLRAWSAAWLARIGALYLAHRALALAARADPDLDSDRQAEAAFTAALDGPPSRRA